MSSGTEELKRKARDWLETKQEVTDLQRQATAVRKRLKLQEQELVRSMCDEQVEEVEVEGKLITRAKSVSMAKRD